MNSPRLEYLLQRYLDAQLGPAEKQELEEWLLSDSRARTEFWQTARVHSALRLWGESEWGRKAARQACAATRVTSPRSWAALKDWLLRKPFAGGAAALVLLAVGSVVAWIHFRPDFLSNGSVEMGGLNRPILHEGPLETSHGIAVLKRMADVIWEPGARQYQPGDTLVPGWLRFRSGAVQIEFTRGARVLLEGPAEINLISSDEAYLKSGRLRAQVPPAAGGFRITSARFTLLDRGTEFGCLIPPEGEPEVHVFKGAVDLSPTQPTRTKQSLKANQAVAVCPTGLRTIPLQRQRFLGEAELARREQSDFEARLANWRRETRSLAAITNTVVHYTFEDWRPWERTLRNEVKAPLPGTDAVLVGCNRAEGRWPGKGAVEFSRPDDRIRVKVPGRFRALTFLAWIRVDSLPNHYSSLAMTESLEVGEVHWALTQNGGLLLSARRRPPTNPADWSGCLVPKVIKTEMLGTWMLFVSVLDTQARTVTHFVNGERVGQGTVASPPFLALGNLEIGNWGVSVQDPRWERLRMAGSTISNRSFKGRLDEFALIAQPLSPAEIRAIYDYGKPLAAGAVLAAGPARVSSP